MLDGFDETPLLDRLKWILALLLVVFLAAPSFIVIPMSFSASEFLEFPPPSLSLRWYAYFLESITWTQAARASFVAGTLTTAIAVPIGVLAAYGATRLGPRMRLLVGGVVVLPAVIPAILIAIGLYFVLARVGMVGTMAGLVLGHVALAIPVVFVVMSAAFSQFDFSQERAARSLGATWRQAWLGVVLPQIGGPILASALLAFVTSLDEVVVAMFVSGGSNATLPKVMFAALRDKIDPTIAVVSTVLLVVATGAVAVILCKGTAGVKP
ncbi:ABC transporter permease [Labrys wisconsinensis]|uniref:Spermidine/putrescine transport system permease protein n=1 Tax=Labrys wisconsinensis TaxID=425677 RepID=A0ABU0JLV7_9HYPH|nr:ABC transporter permease [Labrys wisconsinensis]MDQ0474600.1 putative spermidine/putrescine transport system permease protein [Labrys wisconsinensis]